MSKGLHRIGAEARIQDLFLTRSGKYRGSARPTNSTEQLPGHLHEEIRAARSADPSITGLETRTTWWWVTVHRMPIARYVGRGSHGTDSLREELEAENGGVENPLHSAMAERRCERQGSLQRQDHRGIVGGLRSFGRVDLSIDPPRRAAASGPSLRYRGLRGGEARRGLQRVGPHGRASARCGWCWEQHECKPQYRLSQ